MKISKKEKDSLYIANTNETIEQHPDISCRLKDIKFGSLETSKELSQATRNFCPSQEQNV